MIHTLYAFIVHNFYAFFVHISYTFFIHTLYAAYLHTYIIHMKLWVHVLEMCCVCVSGKRRLNPNSCCCVPPSGRNTRLGFTSWLPATSSSLPTHQVSVAVLLCSPCVAVLVCQAQHYQVIELWSVAFISFRAKNCCTLTIKDLHLSVVLKPCSINVFCFFSYIYIYDIETVKCSVLRMIIS